ncbi:hypothetical protein DP806_16485 [Salmonella enterica subsp. enterica serovar Saintpaul]|nr:hypothetical protein [Salmonella enterica subsp. enterica serovar Saintpaul]
MGKSSSVMPSGFFPAFPFFSPDGCGMPSLRRRFSAGREQVQGMRRNLFHACGKKILPKAASLRPLQLGAAGASLPSQ